MRGLRLWTIAIVLVIVGGTWAALNILGGLEEPEPILTSPMEQEQ